MRRILQLNDGRFESCLLDYRAMSVLERGLPGGNVPIPTSSPVESQTLIVQVSDTGKLHPMLQGSERGRLCQCTVSFVRDVFLCGWFHVDS